MVYGDPEAVKNGWKLLYKGKHKGINYAVVNVKGGWPCGYIEVTGTEYDESKMYNSCKTQDRMDFWRNSCRKQYAKAKSDFCSAVHEGITYSSGWCVGLCYEKPINEDVDRWFLGWDYGRYDDYIWTEDGAGSPFKDSKCQKWTTDDVIADCKSAIKTLTEKASGKKATK